MTEPRTFDATWSELTPRLAAVLAARGVRAQDRDDVLQETALRLYRVWDSLDADQPVWPYAVTIALNLWRDSLRLRVAQPRDVGAAPTADPAADLDVERTVLARQELADVGAALRQLAPEQRRLLLMNDEMTSVVRPLRPAERMARMRVRRELARVVGRASAAVGLLWVRAWVRRPDRADGFATAACVGVLAATVMGGAQAVPAAAAPMPAPVLKPAVVAPVKVATVHVTKFAVTHVARPVLHVRHVRVARPAAEQTQVCAPSAPSSAPKAGTVIRIGAGLLFPNGNDQQPLIETPPMQASSDSGCVQVG